MKFFSTRRIRPGDRPAEPAKGSPSHTAPTTPSSSESGGGRSNLGLAAEVQRRICPVTGIFRDISADYRVGSTVLGRGHFGVVRECTHRATRRVLAVKSVDKSKVRRLDHLRREVYLLHKVDHRGVMKMVDYYEDAEYVHIVTERYTGGELFDWVSAKTTPHGCFAERDAASIIRSLLEAVAYLHDNDFVHRDIKPENVLFEYPREGAPIRLIDFGLSRKHRAGERPMDNPVGTAYYMAPEILEGRYDRSCDLWSVGTVAYILLCGYPPFNGETDGEIFKRAKKGTFDFPEMAWSSKSDEAKDFINCLLRLDPTRRPTAREALGHPWFKAKAGGDAESTDTTQHDDLMARIQSLRMAISNFRKPALVVQ